MAKAAISQDQNGQLTSQIDYEKLSSCIAKAVAEGMDKHTEKYSVTREWMKFIICPVLYLIAVLSGILGIGFFVAEFRLLKIFSETVSKHEIMAIKDYGRLILFFFLGFMLTGVSMSTIFCAKELNHERDKSFVVAVFSGIVSLVALIISLLAFFMGITL